MGRSRAAGSWSLAERRRPRGSRPPPPRRNAAEVALAASCHGTPSATYSPTTARQRASRSPSAVDGGGSKRVGKMLPDEVAASRHL